MTGSSRHGHARGRSAARRTAQHVRGESTGWRLMEQGRIRLLCIALFFALSFGAISVKLVEVSLSGKRDDAKNTAAAPSLPETLNALRGGDMDAGDERMAPDAASVSSPPHAAKRGEILDRNGLVLATSLSTASLVANPRVMNDKERTATLLARTLSGVSLATLRARLKKDTGFVYLKRNLTPAEQQAVNNLGIPGLTFQEEEKRVYPHGSMLSHVLGYVDVDNAGIAGVEKFFDARLRDEDDRKKALELSIDLRLQNIVYDEIRKGMEEFRAIGATGVMLDVKTGEVLAMANLPDFDPHRPGASQDVARFNRATLGAYEMGSTFKTLTAAMALDYGTTSMKSGYDATRPIKIASFTITDTHPQNRWLSVPEIFAYSSNIGTVKMALDVGVERQKAFLAKLGLMKPVALELPERSQPLYPQDWKPINLMTISYGHGMAVSPMHLVRAIATLVGDGALVDLTLVKGGNSHKSRGVEVVKADTVEQVRRLMRLVVLHGTGSKANVPGYRVGGKTGTAEKVGTAGGYNKTAKMNLFISTFPVDAPQYVLLVMLDEPKPTKATFGYATGGWTCAPVAGRIISRMAPLLGVAPAFDVAADDAEQFWPEHHRTPKGSGATSPSVPQIQAQSQPQPVRAAPAQEDAAPLSTMPAVHAVSY